MAGGQLSAPPSNSRPDPQSSAADKTALRRRILVARDAWAETARSQAGHTITACVAELNTYRAARMVLAYMSVGSEFDTSGIVQRTLARGSVLVLPRVNRTRNRLDLFVVSDLERDLAPGVWGIREPRPEHCPAADDGAIDFVLVPGLAFDRRCERLGYGAGFYDRLLPRLSGNPARVAAAFDLQVVDAVPVSANDQPLDLVVTETTAYQRSETQ